MTHPLSLWPAECLSMVVKWRNIVAMVHLLPSVMLLMTTDILVPCRSFVLRPGLSRRFSTPRHVEKIRGLHYYTAAQELGYGNSNAFNKTELSSLPETRGYVRLTPAKGTNSRNSKRVKIEKMSYESATLVEAKLLSALESLQAQFAASQHPESSRKLKSSRTNDPSHEFNGERRGRSGDQSGVPLSLPRRRVVGGSARQRTAISFPTVRECNSALAKFGDNGELLRALRFFVKMRKCATFSDLVRQKYYSEGWIRTPVPAPTLVTYSTLMSRAVQLNKAKIALRLWRLMTLQSDFFTNHQSNSGVPGSHGSDATMIIPDVRAVNILMNAHAKLADVTAAQQLLHDMQEGRGDVPKLTPNLITYNTLIDACHRAGELGVALQVLQEMKGRGIRPDTRTYTSLISAVARKPARSGWKNLNESMADRSSATQPKRAHVQREYYGARDPDMAFLLLNEMIADNISPNGMTYCALIDVCGRCGRSDLALKGLRMMLRQRIGEEQQERIESGYRRDSEASVRSRTKSPLSTEVGAWTAAIDACGKAGRINTAIRLFKRMEGFGATPNTVTCGCLADCLLRAENPTRISETLDLLRYMKERGVEPSEVMYTSLMEHAGRLVKIENKLVRRNNQTFGGDDGKARDCDDPSLKDSAKAIDVYTELMRSLMRGSEVMRQASGPIPHTVNEDDPHTLLLKVFLVFQEMKAVGATPDIACYNSLLRACARAGDVSRALDVLENIKRDGIDPNDISWREMLRAAAKSCNSQSAEEIWELARHFYQYRDFDRRQEQRSSWRPNLEAFELLILAYLRHASVATTVEEKMHWLQRIVDSYEEVLRCDDDRGMSQISIEELQQRQRAVLIVIRAAVSLELLEPTGGIPSIGKSEASKKRTREIAKSLANLGCLMEKLPPGLGDKKTMKALELARSWSRE